MIKSLQTILLGGILSLPLFAAAAPPNILFILADDLGYGDIACYNSESEIPTPNIDRLATQGMRFTDAHSPSTVCTPTRYSLMTGRMAFTVGTSGPLSEANMTMVLSATPSSSSVFINSPTIQSIS